MKTSHGPCHLFGGGGLWFYQTKHMIYSKLFSKSCKNIRSARFACPPLGRLSAIQNRNSNPYCHPKANSQPKFHPKSECRPIFNYFTIYGPSRCFVYSLNRIYLKKMCFFRGFRTPGGSAPTRGVRPCPDPFLKSKPSMLQDFRVIFVRLIPGLCLVYFP